MSQGVAVRERWAMSVEAKALFLITGTILAFGLAVLYSASVNEAQRLGHPSSHFVVQQLQGVLAGAVLFALAAKIDAEKWSEWAWYLMFGSLFLMLVIVIPGMPKWIAPSVYGSHRFLAIPGFGSVQPSEFAKLAVIVWTAMLVVKKGDVMRHLLKGLTPFLLVVGSLALLAAVGRDFSIAATFVLIMGVILYTSGARIGHFLFLGAVGALSVPVLSRWFALPDYVMRRLEPFLNPGSGAKEGAEQLSQSLVAVGSGGVFGQGFGEGMQQSGWVPMSHNDFIGSVIGEEWGFVGMVFVVALFSFYGWLGFRIAQSARTRFQQLVATGITFTMCITAFIHMGVVVGLLPTTGLTLPFVSHGRSNLLLSFVMTGILVNIGSTRQRVYSEPGAAVPDRVPVAGAT